MDKVVSFPLRQALLQRLRILLTSLIMPLIPAMMAFINIYVPSGVKRAPLFTLKTNKQRDLTENRHFEKLFVRVDLPTDCDGVTRAKTSRKLLALNCSDGRYSIVTIYGDQRVECYIISLTDAADRVLHQ